MNNSQFAIFPVQASSLASEVDGLTLALLALCGIVALGVFAAVLFFVVRYREGSRASRKRKRPEGSQDGWKLEIVWTAVPLGIFILLFAYGARAYLEMHTAPPNSLEIYVTGKQWMWKFQHTDGTQELGELHVPLGKPVKLVMTSEDVIHSFSVPAFRMKQDVIPGRYTYTWFQATKTGRYHLFCTQYCGTHHANMSGEIIVLPEAQFQQWASTGVTRALMHGGGNVLARGRKAFELHGCVSCHGTGSSIAAPSLDDLYGRQVKLDNGESVVADENYIRESILNPEAKIVEGYKNIMPSFQGQLAPDEVISLVEYIKARKIETVRDFLKDSGGGQ